MALDLSRTALQIDEMAADIQAREGIRSQRLKAAVSAAQDFLIDDYLKKIQGASATSWALPGIVGHPGRPFLPRLPTQIFLSSPRMVHISMLTDICQHAAM